MEFVFGKHLCKAVRFLDRLVNLSNAVLLRLCEDAGIDVVLDSNSDRNRSNLAEILADGFCEHLLRPFGFLVISITYNRLGSGIQVPLN
jgi:hypothetical protein